VGRGAVTVTVVLLVTTVTVPRHVVRVTTVDTVTTASARRDYYARRDVPQCRFPRLGLGSQSQADSAETRRHGKYVL
jgi:hypothetical protein